MSASSERSNPIPQHPADPGRERLRFGLILAGGHSRRYGQDKGLVQLDGQTLRTRAWNKVAPRTTRCWMSLRPAQSSACPYPVLEDAVPGEGPLAALVHAARSKPVLDAACGATVDWLVLACDMPHVRPESLDRLLEWKGSEGMHAVLLAKPKAQHPEPLAGLWTAEGIAFLDQMFQKGERGFKTLWQQLTLTRIVPDAAMELSNWNRPPSA